MRKIIIIAMAIMLMLTTSCASLERERIMYYNCYVEVIEKVE